MSLEGPAVRLGPQSEEQSQLVLHEVGPGLDVREGHAEGQVVVDIPAGPDTDLDPPPAHLVDRPDDLHEGAGMPVRDRAHENAERNPLGLAGEAGQDRPGIGRGCVSRTRKARVVIASKEGLEPGSIRPPHERELVDIGQTLLGFDHHREPHQRSLSIPGVAAIDGMWRSG